MKYHRIERLIGAGFDDWLAEISTTIDDTNTVLAEEAHLSRVMLYALVITTSKESPSRQDIVPVPHGWNIGRIPLDEHIAHVLDTAPADTPEGTRLLRRLMLRQCPMWDSERRPLFWLKDCGCDLHTGLDPRAINLRHTAECRQNQKGTHAEE